MQKDRRVWGWQIGNEPHIQTGEGLQPVGDGGLFRVAEEEIRNHREPQRGPGGAAFWSYTFTDFDQLRMPFAPMPGPNPYYDVIDGYDGDCF